MAGMLSDAAKPCSRLLGLNLPASPSIGQGLASLYTKLERWDELDAVIGRLVDIFDKLSVPPSLVSRKRSIEAS